MPKATPQRPSKKRYKPGRVSCPECGGPLSNDIDDDGNNHGLVCMNRYQSNGQPDGGRPCPRYGEKILSSRNENGDYGNVKHARTKQIETSKKVRVKTLVERKKRIPWEAPH